jgi:predicted DNA binding protein
MSKVVELTVPTEQFALAETFRSVPDATFEAVPVAAHPPRGSMSFFSAESSRGAKLDSALRSDESTEDVTRLSESGSRQLYEISWRPRVRTVLGVFLQTTGSLLCAWGRADRWNLRFLFPDQESISEICDNWRTHGIDPSIQRVVGVAGKFGFPEMKLSKCQHDTLLTAYEMDYYDIPRGAQLEGVADELQVSHQALSERLRRGHRNLVETALCESPTPLKKER